MALKKLLEDCWTPHIMFQTQKKCFRHQKRRLSDTKQDSDTRKESENCRYRREVCTQSMSTRECRTQKSVIHQRTSCTRERHLHTHTHTRECYTHKRVSCTRERHALSNVRFRPNVCGSNLLTNFRQASKPAPRVVFCTMSNASPSRSSASAT